LILLKQKYFLTVCRLAEEQKDVKTLIEAFSLYKGEEKLVIAGDGPDRKSLEDFCIQKNLNDKVIFLGMVDNPFHFMKNAQAFILSSKVEGFGLVLVEALSVASLIDKLIKLNADIVKITSKITSDFKLFLVTYAKAFFNIILLLSTHVY